MTIQELLNEEQRLDLVCDELSARLNSGPRCIVSGLTLTEAEAERFLKEGWAGFDPSTRFYVRSICHNGEVEVTRWKDTFILKTRPA